jgi:methionyl-tRNA formyltransferase
MREGSPGPEGNAEYGMGARSGEVLEARRGLLRIACGTGAVDLIELQCPGKKRMSAADFLNGMRVKAGERFGSVGT